jgi:uncharacterized protein (TIGR03435 family)
MTMARFAELLPQNFAMGADYPGNRPVVDQTEIAGAWDFDFHFTQRGRMGFAGGENSSISLMETLEKQLGLLL